MSGELLQRRIAKHNLRTTFSFGMDSDFTFCQVGSSGNQDTLKTKKLASDIDAITIKDEGSNGTMSDQSSGSVWKGGGVPRVAASGKQEKVGYLSVTVIEASSTNEYSQFPKKVPSGDGGKSVKPAARTKVPFEKGYSQMDWLKLTQTHPDLAGLKGQSNKRLISMNEVKHQKGDSMWTVLKGRVYNLSPYMRFHPGGVDILKKAVGKDCTSLFSWRVSHLHWLKETAGLPKTDWMMHEFQLPATNASTGAHSNIKDITEEAKV